MWRRLLFRGRAGPFGQVSLRLVIVGTVWRPIVMPLRAVLPAVVGDFHGGFLVFGLCFTGVCLVLADHVSEKK